MPIETDDQARALARVIHLIRPDWTEDSFYKVALKAHHDRNPLLQRPFEDIIIAATRKAADPNARTPAVVWLDGKHWDPPPPGYAPGPPADPCQDHPEESANHCRCCRSDVITGLRPPDKIGKHHDIPTT